MKVQTCALAVVASALLTMAAPSFAINYPQMAERLIQSKGAAVTLKMPVVIDHESYTPGGWSNGLYSSDRIWAGRDSWCEAFNSSKTKFNKGEKVRITGVYLAASDVRYPKLPEKVRSAEAVVYLASPTNPRNGYFVRCVSIENVFSLNLNPGGKVFKLLNRLFSGL